MNPELESEKPIHLPDDFAERVLREVERRRTRARGIRTFGAALILAAALVMAGRVPFRLARGLAYRHAAPAAIAFAGGPELEKLPEDLEGDSDLDPGSYFLASLQPQAEPADDGDTDLLGQE